jgi:hypothetical protein
MWQINRKCDGFLFARPMQGELNAEMLPPKSFSLGP